MTDSTQPQKPRWKRLAVIGAAILAVGLLIYGASWKFSHDRESAMNFQPHETRVRVERSTSQPVTHSYSAKEIEEARKSGKKLPGMNTLPPNLPNNSGEEAVQRSLRTLDEINRINEMNRRLIEQQQRSQQQR
jgi:hypothetical protein